MQAGVITSRLYALIIQRELAKRNFVFTLFASTKAHRYNHYMNSFDEFALTVPRVLLPAQKDLATWCVIACDQFTQDEHYWQAVKQITDGHPSTLNLILPEILLAHKSDEEIQCCASAIQEAMRDYLASGVFDDERTCFVYVERRTAYGRMRRGLVAAVDLEGYEWQPFSKSLIRATEATIESRIPARKKIRQGAALEVPHVMLLANDPDDVFIGGAAHLAKRKPPVYSGSLMLGSGSITGWAVDDAASLDEVRRFLGVLKGHSLEEGGSCFLFAVGDGNHSLATAKAVWQEEKHKAKPNEALRFALVEIVNIFDQGLTFEPIHRVLFDCGGRDLIPFLCERLCCEAAPCQSEEELALQVKASPCCVGVSWREGSLQKFAVLDTRAQELAVSRLQPLLDEFCRQHGCTIDFIHGSDEVLKLARVQGTTALLLPPVDKASFFDTIARRGPLPRKSFSMGEASEKRFYLECRKLFLATQ